MKPPTDPKAELAAALVKGAVSAIPIAGGVISEVGNLYLNPLEKRKQVWVDEVCRAIEQIQDRFLRLPGSLQDDDAFISFLYQTTILALKNHQREKLQALSSALVSAADPESMSEDIIFQFIRYIDELSVTHLHILAGLEEHSRHFSRLDQLEHVYARFQSLTKISCDRATFRSFVQDLDGKFLIRIGDIEDFTEYASQKSHILRESSSTRPLEVTDLGRTFLSFVRQNEP